MTPVFSAVFPVTVLVIAQSSEAACSFRIAEEEAEGAGQSSGLSSASVCMCGRVWSVLETRDDPNRRSPDWAIVDGERHTASISIASRHGQISSCHPPARAAAGPDLPLPGNYSSRPILLLDFRLGTITMHTLHLPMQLLHLHLVHALRRARRCLL